MDLSRFNVFDLPLAILLVGAILVLWGRRGRRVDDHPVCRRCKFDLTGRAADSNRCPECGGDLSRPRAIASGNRQARIGIVVFALILMAGSSAWFAHWGWSAFKVR